MSDSKGHTGSKYTNCTFELEVLSEVREFGFLIAAAVEGRCFQRISARFLRRCRNALMGARPSPSQV